MLYVLYALGITIILIILGSIVPFIQYFVEKRKASIHENNSTNVISYTFSKQLFDADFNPSFNSVAFAPRTLVGARGWVRGPHGKVLTDDDFKQKKDIELKNDLP